jgi:Spy/CpxP family protein refolding chaperone
MRTVTRTKTVKILAVTLALAMTATIALAQPGNQHHGKDYGGGHPCPMNQGMGMHKGMGKHQAQKMMGQDCSWCMGAMQGLSAEQKKTFMDKTVDLRREMMEKHFSYREALRNSGTDKQKLETLKKEMNDLRAKIMQARQEVVGQ